MCGWGKMWLGGVWEPDSKNGTIPLYRRPSHCVRVGLRDQWKMAEGRLCYSEAGS